MNLGAKIFEYRKKAGLSQEELGYKLNVTRQSVSLWETNQAQPSADNLIALSKILGVSLDELCGKSPTPTSDAIILEEPLFKAETIYTEDLYIKSFKTIHKTNLCINYIAIILSIIMGIGIIFSDANKGFILLPIICICIFITYIIRLNANINKATKETLTSKPNNKSEFFFYENCVIIQNTSDNSTSRYIKKYSDIKTKGQDAKFIYIVFDRIISAIDKSSCTENEEQLYNLLNLRKPETANNKKGKINTLLLILFIITLLTPLISLSLVSISIMTSPIPDFPFVMIEHMWKFYLIIPITAISIILGIIFTCKGYSGIKNIIVGIIMTLILTIFGSFSGIFFNNISHDVEYVKELSETTNLTLPTDAYIAIAYNFHVDGDSLAMIKFNDSTVYTTNIDGNKNWKNDTSFIPSNAFDLYVLTLTSEYEYYLVYNKTSNKYNTFDGELIYLSYDVDEKILFVYCYS